MKKVILITALILTQATARTSPVIYNNIGKSRIPYEKILDLVARDLGLDTLDFKLYISEAGIFDNSTAGIHQIPGGVALIVNDGAIKQDAVDFFLHELVHVSQMMTRKLMVRKNGTWFDGKRIDTSQPDYLQPQEQEAIKKSTQLSQRYRKQLKDLIKTQQP